MSFPTNRAFKDLVAAAQKSRLNCRDQTNLFCYLGFEGEKARLGWVIPPQWEAVAAKLNDFEKLDLAREIKQVIFVGMGGSINAIKALKTAFAGSGKIKIDILDSIDPKAIYEILAKIDDWNQTLVVGISKSATTEETRLLMKTLKNKYDLLAIDYRKHFLWLTDPENRKNLTVNGWGQTPVMPIQVDDRSDIGGRFSAPNTLVFLLPLYFLGGKETKFVQNIWQKYLQAIDRELVDKMAQAARKIVDSGSEFLAIVLDSYLTEAMENWITQLFQESLGSKLEMWLFHLFKSSGASKLSGFNLKTLVAPLNEVPNYFKLVNLDLKNTNRMVEMMVNFYAAQLLVAFIAYGKRVNFVDQPEVENYKRIMRGSKPGELNLPQKSKIGQIIEETNKVLENKPEIKFVEIVCYWHLDKDKRQKIKEIFQRRLPGREILVFEGSDWNHHSLQAAVKDPRTLFEILIYADYSEYTNQIQSEMGKNNVETLRAIAYSTYKSLKDKALFMSYGE